MEFEALIEAMSRLDLEKLKHLIEHAEGLRIQRREEMRAELERQAGAIGLIVNEPKKLVRRKRRGDQAAE
jgi:hypothetical protein